MIIAFVGNTLSKPEVVSWFLIYFMAVGFVVVLVFLRVRLLKILLKFIGPVCLGEKKNCLCFLFTSRSPLALHPTSYDSKNADFTVTILADRVHLTNTSLCDESMIYIV